MSTFMLNSSASRPSNPDTGAQTTVLGTDLDQAPDSGHGESTLSSSFQDDSESVYSYSSTFSTNYTMSNLPGPGRLLGNIFSKAGSSLEHGLGKIAYRAGVGAYAKLEDLRQETHRHSTQKQKERICETLLGYARYSILYVCIIRAPSH